MRAGSEIYNIEIEGNKTTAPDLSHLQKTLEEKGFTFSAPLSRLQSGQANLSEINFVSRDAHQTSIHAGIHSYVRIHEGKFQLVADPSARRLDEFAKQYTPVPTTQDTHTTNPNP